MPSSRSAGRRAGCDAWPPGASSSRRARPPLRRRCGGTPRTPRTPGSPLPGAPSGCFAACARGSRSRCRRRGRPGSCGRSHSPPDDADRSGSRARDRSVAGVHAAVWWQGLQPAFTLVWIMSPGLCRSWQSLHVSTAEAISSPCSKPSRVPSRVGPRVVRMTGGAGALPQVLVKGDALSGRAAGRRSRS